MLKYNKANYYKNNIPVVLGNELIAIYLHDRKAMYYVKGKNREISYNITHYGQYLFQENCV